MKGCLLVIGLLYVLGTNCISANPDMRNFTQYLVKSRNKNVRRWLTLFGRKHNCIFQGNSLKEKEIKILMNSELENIFENEINNSSASILSKVTHQLIEYTIAPRNKVGVNIINDLKNRSDCFFRQRKYKLGEQINVLIPLRFIQEFKKILNPHYLLILSLNEFSNSTTYLILSSRYATVKALNNFQARRSIIIQNTFQQGEEIFISIDSDSEDELKKMLIDLNCIYYRVIKPSLKEVVAYRLKAETKNGLQFLKRISKKDCCIFDRKPLYMNDLYYVQIHPSFTIYFEKMLRSNSIEHAVLNYTGDSMYIVIAEDLYGIRFLHKLFAQAFVNFLTDPFINSLVYIRIQRSYQSILEYRLRQYNVKYYSDIDLFKYPGLRNFYEFRVKPMFKKNHDNLNLLTNWTSCVQRVFKPSGSRIITVHPEYKSLFELFLQKINVEYKILNWMPKKPTDNNYCHYILKLSQPAHLDTIQRYQNECDCFEMPSTFKRNFTNITIHPEYRSEFETILKSANIKFSLVSQMPDFIDCNRYNFYMVKPKDNITYQVLKNFITETDFRYWKSNWPQDHQVEVMIKKEFAIRFEEIIQAFKMKSRLLNLN